MSELQTYQTIESGIEIEFKRSNSRFIGIALPATDHNEIQHHLDGVKKRFPDASHHCTAYRLLKEGKVEEASDNDGEPLNSAGPPILQVIAGRELLNLMVVVVRYFGGTKLGVGGLIRAYGDAAKMALDEIPVITKIPQAQLRIRYPHALTGAVMGVLHHNGVDIDSVDYDELAQAYITIPLSQRAFLEQELQEACAGQAEVHDD